MIAVAVTAGASHAPVALNGKTVMAVGARQSVVTKPVAMHQPATTHAAAIPAAALSPCALVPDWTLRGGASTLNSVQFDVAETKADITAQHLSALISDVPVLASDVSIALADKSPVDTAGYTTALNTINKSLAEFAYSVQSDGSDDAAEEMLGDAGTELAAVKAALDACP
jgi:hypothetical protein